MSLKINLGCGPKSLGPEWVGVDADGSVLPDILCDIMAYEPHRPVDAVAAIHVLEHLKLHDVITLCSNVRKWLEPGGTFIVEMPDREKCFRLAANRMPVGRPAVWDDPPIQGVGGLLGDRPARHGAWVMFLAENASEIVSRVSVGDYESFLPACFNVPLENHRNVWSEKLFADVLRGLGFADVRSESPQFHGKRANRDMRVVATK